MSSEANDAVRLLMGIIDKILVKINLSKKENPTVVL